MGWLSRTAPKLIKLVGDTTDLNKPYYLKLNQFLLLSPINKALTGLIFMFPVLAATVKHGGTTVYLLLFLISMFNVKAAIKSLTKDERYILFGFIVFVAVMLFGFINTDDIRIATHHLERYLRFLIFIPIFLMLRHRNLQLIGPFLLGCVIAAIVMAIQAYIQVEILNKGVASGAYHKIIFGDTAIIIAGVCIAGLIVLPREKKMQIFLGVGILFALYASVLSFTRSSWLAVIAMLLMCIILFKNSINKEQWKKIGLSFVILLIIGSIWQPKIISDGIKSGINDIKQYRINPEIHSSWGDRLNMWDAAWTLFLERPITGIGVGDFRYERNRLMAEGKAIKGYAYGHAHNHYLNVLAENGIIGLITLIACIFIFPFRAFYRQWIRSENSTDKRFWSLVGILTLTNFFVFGIAEVWLGRNPFVNIYCVLLLVSLTGLHSKQVK